jgi:hypothetical protein
LVVPVDDAETVAVVDVVTVELTMPWLDRGGDRKAGTALARQVD